MSVPTYNYVWQQGEDGLISMVYETGTVPAPINLTGYKLRMDVRNTAGALLYSFNSDDFTDTSAPGIDVPGPADNEAVLGSAGQININVPRSASLSGGAFFSEITNTLLYDVFLRDTSNKQRKILRGTIVFEASQTRWT